MYNERMECRKCGEDIVHPGRKYCLCLDCFMDEIMEHTKYTLPIRFRKSHYDQCSMCNGLFKKGSLEYHNGEPTCVSCIDFIYRVNQDMEEESEE